jgi:Raf kinase inhibitor-like YbhB/YbcL family protein
MLGNLWRKLSTSSSRSSPPKGKPSRPASFRPTVEALEDRTLPAISLTCPALGVTQAGQVGVFSDQFVAGATRPATYRNQSPPLRITDLPTGTVSLAVVCEDLNSVRSVNGVLGSGGQFTSAPGFIHWVAYNINPAAVLRTGELATNIPKEAAPYGSEGLHQGLNGNGDLDRQDGLNTQQIQARGGIGYLGPAPPDGKTHTYEFQVYALDTRLSFPTPPTWTEVQNAMGLNGVGPYRIVAGGIATFTATFLDPLVP